VRPERSQTLPRGGAESLHKARLRDLLAEARERTLRLVAPVSEENLDRVHDPLMSPLVWDLGHIAAFEDLWLCQRAGGLPPLRPDLAEVYDAAETPRQGRGGLPYLRRDDALGFMADVRERALGVLERVDLSDAGNRLNRGAFVWAMLVQHEQQHTETMLQTLQIAEPGVYAPDRVPLPAASVPVPDIVPVDGGPFLVGDGGEGFAYDNERPRHELSLRSFAIDRTPVTAGAFLAFVEDGGYRRPELWSEEGRAVREREGWERPRYWTTDGRERRFERVEPIDRDRPVMHLSWYEADAYARWRGARLPTEQEWERAAAGSDPARANLDQLGFGPAPAGAYPAGASSCGALGMLGDCWEWTASDFVAYPGFRAFPYREYSEVFFGSTYKVLRGGSWATRTRVARTTFRNWDFPQRRQLFSGFRCAVDA
jgi:gamma-glutamyl hercynylcysteine S-oxide synthase